MKSLFNKILTLSGATVLMLSACKKDGAVITATNGTPGQLSASATTLVLNNAKLTDPSIVETFTLVQPNFGYNAAITNTLQIDVPTDNWANPYTVSMNPDVFTQGFNTNDFNNILLKAGAKGNVSGQVSVRVKSAINANTFVYSNVLTLTVTPFNLKSWLYVPGAYEGWANPGPQEDSLYSATGNGIYVGIINFTAGNNQFLVTPKKNWDNKYATNDAASTSGTSSNYSVTYNGSNNFYAPSTAGYYLVTLNTNNNTMSIVPANYYSIIGDAAQGWGTDVAMKYVNDGNGMWTATVPLVSSGSFKVRQNNDWTFSWGIPKSGSEGYGIANTLNDTSNDNIPVAANGNYAVSFYSPAAAKGTVPAVTTTYSSVKQ
ncbi:SusE domain-containing protein [Mucilaginibacter sp. PPCGB 2223]|uniref:SusE domain-containing protein n=1 Tax=Mucilaginibacter sp. PPCGB 2223 TaxID=1886027 RepID=UPI0015865545|nr:SusE domain-containing protein [Mucilaginibacter sp. PPCGB 2223]